MASAHVSVTCEIGSCFKNNGSFVPSPRTTKKILQKPLEQFALLKREKENQSKHRLQLDWVSSDHTQPHIATAPIQRKHSSLGIRYTAWSVGRRGETNRGQSLPCHRSYPSDFIHWHFQQPTLKNGNQTGTFGSN